MEVLRVWWAADAGGSGRRGAQEAALDELLARYREPHRRYHTVKHVETVVGTCRRLLAVESVPDPRAVCLAAWFHDAVYDPRATGDANERASAALAERVLAGLGHPTSRVAEVARLVLLTARHVTGVVEVDAGGAVLLDADLAILAERPAVYQAYVTGVRAEYGHLDGEAWRTGRVAVLRSLLARPALYVTASMRPAEPRARANLTAELATLDTPHPTSPGSP